LPTVFQSGWTGTSELKKSSSNDSIPTVYRICVLLHAINEYSKKLYSGPSLLHHVKKYYAHLGSSELYTRLLGG